MQAYLDLLHEVISSGEERTDRTGTGTTSLFGRQIRVDLRDGFPLLTTKRLHFRSIVHELIWFLRGDTNVGYLRANGVSIWDEWADDKGELGPIYGKQWRCWRRPHGDPIDQIERVVDSIGNDPFSRRHIVVAWNPAELDAMALPPCHVLFQFHVGRRGLSCHLYQRSADVFLGLPFNLASYALLTHLIAAITAHAVDSLVISLGDVHLYQNHREQALTQLARKPRRLPSLVLRPPPARIENLRQLRFEQFRLQGYDAAAPISAPIAV